MLAKNLSCFASPAFNNMQNPIFDAWIYFDTPESISGFLLPFLLSLLSLFVYRKSWTWETSVALISSMIVAWDTAHMGQRGLHTFSVGVFFLLALAWRSKRSAPFPFMLGYVFAFFTALSSDVVHGLLHPANGLWATWYWGIGGAGFHDDLFIAPIFGVFAVAITRLGNELSTILVRKSTVSFERSQKVKGDEIP
jgi:hypothetical protein